MISPVNLINCWALYFKSHYIPFYVSTWSHVLYLPLILSDINFLFYYYVGSTSEIYLYLAKDLESVCYSECSKTSSNLPTFPCFSRAFVVIVWHINRFISSAGRTRLSCYFSYCNDAQFVHEVLYILENGHLIVWCQTLFDILQSITERFFPILYSYLFLNLLIEICIIYSDCTIEYYNSKIFRFFTLFHEICSLSTERRYIFSEPVLNVSLRIFFIYNTSL